MGEVANDIPKDKPTRDFSRSDRLKYLEELKLLKELGKYDTEQVKRLLPRELDQAVLRMRYIERLNRLYEENRDEFQTLAVRLETSDIFEMSARISAIQMAKKVRMDLEAKGNTLLGFDAETDVNTVINNARKERKEGGGVLINDLPFAV